MAATKRLAACLAASTALAVALAEIGRAHV